MVTEPEEVPSSKVCSGITDCDLQCFAKLPPLNVTDKYEPYYLEVEYIQNEHITTCKTTVRSQTCLRHSESTVCASCLHVKQMLLKKQKRKRISDKQRLKKHTPLSTASKQKLSNALKTARLEKVSAEKELESIKLKIEEESLLVSDESHSQLNEIFKGCEMKQDSFIYKFWNEQQKAFARKSGGMRWHPMMVRFAVLLHSQSPSAYRSLREIGVIKLPAESTLRDYTNFLHPRSGFQIEVFLELKKITENLDENERWVCLLHDEIAIKSDLVYDFRSGEMVGFIDSDRRDYKSARDEHLATHALVFMVIGVTSNVKMSIGYFPTRTATADEIFPHLWTAIGMLESICNLKVIASTSDKASPNQRLIKIHGSNYKAQNIFAPDRFIYFFSDVPHLIKTVRNNLASSGWGKNTKQLWNNGFQLLWSHIYRLYKEDSERELRRTKLTAEHIFLTPQSVMRVNLAAQVLSHSVGRIMQEFGGSDCQETAKFILLIDKFFDCLNTRCFSEGKQKANPYLLPYTTETDERFHFLGIEFLNYIEEWRKSVMDRDGFTKSEKQKMFISNQTYEGLKTTVCSAVEAIPFLLKSGVKVVLSNRFCQDPLESHFGRHRCMGIRAENPSLWTYGYQENKLRIQRNIALSILPKGNVRGKRQRTECSIDEQPIPKIKRRRVKETQFLSV